MLLGSDGFASTCGNRLLAADLPLEMSASAGHLAATAQAKVARGYGSKDKPQRWLVNDESPSVDAAKHCENRSECSTASSNSSRRGLGDSTGLHRQISSPAGLPIEGQNQQRPQSAKELQKSDVQWLLRRLSPEDRVHFTRPWFSLDCKRRYRELEKDPSKLLGVEKLQGIVKMFPCLALDYSAEGRCIRRIDGQVPTLLAIFDSDDDGFLSEDDFQELMRFCHSWRSSFYLKADVGKSVRPVSPAVIAAAKGILKGPARSASIGALKKNDGPSPPMLRQRRGSGFGPRMLDLEPMLPPKQEAESPDKLHRKEDKEPEKVSDLRKKPPKEYLMARRGSAPAALNFTCDASRGSFYASLAGYVNTIGSRSRESSPGGLSADSDS